MIIYLFIQFSKRIINLNGFNQCTLGLNRRNIHLTIHRKKKKHSYETTNVVYSKITLVALNTQMFG